MSFMPKPARAAARRGAILLLLAAALCAALAQNGHPPDAVDDPDVVVQIGPPGLDQPFTGGAGQCFDPAVPHHRSTYDLIPQLYTNWDPPKPRIHDERPTGPHVSASGGPAILDRSNGPSIAAPNGLRSWESIGRNDWIYPDCDVAAGPCHVIVVTNDDWAIYNKRGDELFHADFNDWFGSSDPFHSPVCVYDTHSDRFVFCVLRSDEANTECDWVVCISDDDNPEGTWWWYYFDATLNGGTPSDCFALYPSMGFDSDAVYLTAQMYEFGGFFQYAKVRILDKEEIYNAQAAGWYDFWDLHDDASTVSNYVRAVKIFSFPATSYVVNSACDVWGSGDYVVLWKISDPVGTPSIAGTKLTVAAYSSPPAARQPDTEDTVYNMGSRLLSAAYAYNYLWTAHAVAYDWGSGDESVIKYYRIYTPTPSVDIDQIWGAPDYDYYFPAICVNSSGEMGMCFARSSESEYVSVRYSGQQPPDPIQASEQLVAGDGSWTHNIWGFHYGISLDGGDMDTFWNCGQYAKAGDTWGTYVGEMSFDRTADVTPPTDWSNFSPFQTTDRTPDVSIDVRDTGTGLYVDSAEYRYTTDGGSSWSSWESASCTGENCSTWVETITHESVPFGQDSMTDNMVQFRIEDMSRNVGTSSPYRIEVDGLQPTPWGDVDPALTSNQTPDVSITIRDATSGLDVSTAEYWYSKDGGSTYIGPYGTSCTGSDGTTDTETVTAYEVPFYQDSMTENVIWFAIQDMFGNLSGTGWLTVHIDASEPREWANFSPTGHVNGGLQHCTLDARDPMSGLDVSTAEYRYSVDGGTTWSGWCGASCTGSDGSTEFETLSADVPFNNHDLSAGNLVSFRVSDMAGSVGTSGAWPVYIDKLSYVEGSVTLGDFVGDPDGMLLRLTLYDGATPVEAVTTAITSGFTYSVWFESTGGTKMWAKPIHHLSASQAATLDGLASNLLNWNWLFNGDGDDSNVIDLPDLNIVLLNFGLAGPVGDYNGDGSVDLIDMNIVLLDFGTAGS
jgi:hypothetical protein